MSKKDDENLTKTIKYAPALLLMVSFAMMLFLFYENNQHQHDLNRSQLHNNLIDEQRNIVRQQIHRLRKKVRSEISNAELNTLKELEWEIEEYKNVILETYRQSSSIDTPLFRNRIQGYVRALQSSRGFSTSIRDGAGVVILSSGGSHDDHEFYKRSIGIEELGWEITVSIDKRIITKRTQRQVLNWLKPFAEAPEHLTSAELRIFESNDIPEDYLFVLDSDYKVILHPRAELLSKTFYEATGFDLKTTLYNFVNYEGFVHYQFKFTEEQEGEGSKISYITTIPEWGWLIGSGFYLSRFEQDLAEREEKASAQNAEQAKRMGVVILAMSVVLFVTSLLLGRNVHKRLKRYQFRVKRDMFKIMDAKERLQRTIDYDALTGLPSQFKSKEVIDNAIKEAALNSERVLIILVDIVDLKRINNRHTHRIGDLLIKEIAKQFKGIISEKDFVCRYGGDEFLFCFKTSNQPWKLNNKVESIRAVFSEPFVIEDNVCAVDCRMGVSGYPESGGSAEQLIDQAISVLYRAKTKLHSQILVINDELSEMMQVEERIEDDLSSAIDNGEIDIFFQPQVDSQTEQLRGLEALVRWSHPELGFVRPDLFVEIAEELGLARKLGDYVARNACKQVVEKYPNETSDVTVSINISPQELLLEDFVNEFIDAVTEAGIRKNRVVLEITENILIEEPKAIIPVLQRIRNAGIHVSMDDFGTGYSSLSYFNTLPISELKIDRAFVKDLTGDENEDISLIRAIVAIGKSKNLLIVVEGVETKVQRDLVSALGCDLIQGYYYSAPKPIDDVFDLFTNN